MNTRSCKSLIRKGLKQMPMESLQRLLKIIVRNPKRVLMNSAIYEKGKG